MDGDVADELRGVSGDVAGRPLMRTKFPLSGPTSLHSVRLRARRLRTPATTDVVDFPEADLSPEAAILRTVGAIDNVARSPKRCTSKERGGPGGSVGRPMTRISTAIGTPDGWIVE
jgi:hypothetical protein